MFNNRISERLIRLADRIIKLETGLYNTRQEVDRNNGENIEVKIWNKNDYNIVNAAEVIRLLLDYHKLEIQTNDKFELVPRK